MRRESTARGADARATARFGSGSQAAFPGAAGRAAARIAALGDLQPVPHPGAGGGGRARRVSRRARAPAPRACCRAGQRPPPRSPSRPRAARGRTAPPPGGLGAHSRPCDTQHPPVGGGTRGWRRPANAPRGLQAACKQPSRLRAALAAPAPPPTARRPPATAHRARSSLPPLPSAARRAPRRPQRRAPRRAPRAAAPQNARARTAGGSPSSALLAPLPMAPRPARPPPTSRDAAGMGGRGPPRAAALPECPPTGRPRRDRQRPERRRRRAPSGRRAGLGAAPRHGAAHAHERSVGRQCRAARGDELHRRKATSELGGPDAGWLTGRRGPVRSCEPPEDSQERQPQFFFPYYGMKFPLSLTRGPPCGWGLGRARFIATVARRPAGPHLPPVGEWGAPVHIFFSKRRMRIIENHYLHPSLAFLGGSLSPPQLALPAQEVRR